MFNDNIPAETMDQIYSGYGTIQELHDNIPDLKEIPPDILDSDFIRAINDVDDTSSGFLVEEYTRMRKQHEYNTSVGSWQHVKPGGMAAYIKERIQYTGRPPSDEVIHGGVSEASIYAGEGVWEGDRIENFMMSFPGSDFMELHDPENLGNWLPDAKQMFEDAVRQHPDAADFIFPWTSFESQDEETRTARYASEGADLMHLYRLNQERNNQVAKNAALGIVNTSPPFTTNTSGGPTPFTDPKMVSQTKAELEQFVVDMSEHDDEHLVGYVRHVMRGGLNTDDDRLMMEGVGDVERAEHFRKGIKKFSRDVILLEERVFNAWYTEFTYDDDESWDLDAEIIFDIAMTDGQLMNLFPDGERDLEYDEMSSQQQAKFNQFKNRAFIREFYFQGHKKITSVDAMALGQLHMPQLFDTNDIGYLKRLSDEQRLAEATFNPERADWGDTRITWQAARNEVERLYREDMTEIDGWMTGQQDVNKQRHNYIVEASRVLISPEINSVEELIGSIKTIHDDPDMSNQMKGLKYGAISKILKESAKFVANSVGKRNATWEKVSILKRRVTESKPGNRQPSSLSNGLFAFSSNNSTTMKSESDNPGMNNARLTVVDPWWNNKLQSIYETITPQQILQVNPTILALDGTPLNYAKHITGVEMSPDMVEVSRQGFGLMSSGEIMIGSSKWELIPVLDPDTGEPVLDKHGLPTEEMKLTGEEAAQYVILPHGPMTSAVIMIAAMEAEITTPSNEGNPAIASIANLIAEAFKGLSYTGKDLAWAMQNDQQGVEAWKKAQVIMVSAVSQVIDHMQGRPDFQKLLRTELGINQKEYSSIELYLNAFTQKLSSGKIGGTRNAVEIWYDVLKDAETQDGFYDRVMFTLDGEMKAMGDMLYETVTVGYEPNADASRLTFRPVFMGHIPQDTGGVYQKTVLPYMGGGTQSITTLGDGEFYSQPGPNNSFPKGEVNQKPKSITTNAWERIADWKKKEILAPAPATLWSSASAIHQDFGRWDKMGFDLSGMHMDDSKELWNTVADNSLAYRTGEHPLKQLPIEIINWVKEAPDKNVYVYNQISGDKIQHTGRTYRRSQLGILWYLQGLASNKQTSEIARNVYNSLYHEKDKGRDAGKQRGGIRINIKRFSEQIRNFWLRGRPQKPPIAPQSMNDGATTPSLENSNQMAAWSPGMGAIPSMIAQIAMGLTPEAMGIGREEDRVMALQEVRPSSARGGARIMAEHLWNHNPNVYQPLVGYTEGDNNDVPLVSSGLWRDEREGFWEHMNRKEDYLGNEELTNASYSPTGAGPTLFAYGYHPERLEKALLDNFLLNDTYSEYGEPTQLLYTDTMKRLGMTDRQNWNDIVTAIIKNKVGHISQRARDLISDGKPSIDNITKPYWSSWGRVKQAFLGGAPHDTHNLSRPDGFGMSPEQWAEQGHETIQFQQYQRSSTHYGSGVVRDSEDVGNYFPGAMEMMPLIFNELIQARVGRYVNGAWQEPQIPEYLEGLIEPKISQRASLTSDQNIFPFYHALQRNIIDRNGTQRIKVSQGGVPMIAPDSYIHDEERNTGVFTMRFENPGDEGWAQELTIRAPWALNEGFFDTNFDPEIDKRQISQRSNLHKDAYIGGMDMLAGVKDSANWHERDEWNKSANTNLSMDTALHPEHQGSRTQPIMVKEITSDEELEELIGTAVHEQKIKVQQGETLSHIAEAANVTVSDILKANPEIKDPNKISVGQELWIPKPKATPTKILERDKRESPLLHTHVEELEGWAAKPTIVEVVEGKKDYTVGYGHLLDGGTRSRKAFAEAFPKKNYNLFKGGGGKLSKEESKALLKIDLPWYTDKARDITEHFDTYSFNLRKHIVSATFRGMWQLSPEARRLLAAGQFNEAAKEYLNADDYRDAITDGLPGVRIRMDNVADAIREEGQRRNK